MNFPPFTQSHPSSLHIQVWMCARLHICTCPDTLTVTQSYKVFYTRACVCVCARLSNRLPLLQAGFCSGGSVRMCAWLSLIIYCFTERNIPYCCQQMPSLQSDWAGHGHLKPLGLEPPCWMIDRNWDRNQVWNSSAVRSRVSHRLPIFSGTTLLLSECIVSSKRCLNF